MEQNFKTYMELQEENKQLRDLTKMICEDLKSKDENGGITSCNLCVYNSDGRCNSGKKICSFKYIFADEIKKVLGD